MKKEELFDTVLAAAKAILLVAVLTAMADLPTPVSVRAEDGSSTSNTELLVDRTFNSSLVLTISPNVLGTSDTDVAVLSQLLVSRYVFNFSEFAALDLLCC